MAKPKVGDMTWRRIYHSRVGEVYEADEDDFFFKVVANDSRPKYFYGETAFHDYQRFMSDLEVKEMYR